MQFVLISIISLAALGIIAALASIFTKGGTDEPIVEARDCSTCSSVATGECKIGCLLEERKRNNGEGKRAVGKEKTTVSEEK